MSQLSASYCSRCKLPISPGFRRRMKWSVTTTDELRQLGEVPRHMPGDRSGACGRLLSRRPAPARRRTWIYWVCMSGLAPAFLLILVGWASAQTPSPVSSFIGDGRPEGESAGTEFAWAFRSLSDTWEPVRLASAVPERLTVAAQQPAGMSAPASGPGSAERRDYYVEARSVGTRRETEPPRYVRSLDATGLPDRLSPSWLDAGLDQRLRFEYRNNDFRRPVPSTDWPFLLRARAYLGVKEIIDPLRFAVELEDARRYNSQFPLDNRDVNEHEIIQMFGELHFADALGVDRPLRFQAGRLAMEYTDRRLIARNEWRNTTNNFEGFRAILGRQQNDWQLDLLALQPVERLISRPDRADTQRWFYGAVGDWRRWSDVITLQPYYLVLDQSGDGQRPHRLIHTLALRGYGVVGDTGYDYDFDLAWQLGTDRGRRHEALGFTTEIGYTWQQPWKPRLSGFFGYASGDRDPDDQTSERFDRLFGFARPWSSDDYFLWENLIAPKTRLEFQPTDKVRVDMGYSVFWLASATDAWATAQRRDPTGQSGDFIGHELDIRLRTPLTARIDLTLGYAHFIPGAFTRNTGWSAPSNFLYVETSTRLFK